VIEEQRFPAEPGQLVHVRNFITRRATADSFSANLMDLLIAVSEACANAIMHSGTREMVVRWTLEGDTVQITVEDQGVFRPNVSVPELDGIGHRGIQLMLASMDEVAIRQGTHERPGTTVRLVKRKIRQPV
jgi:anti-sigma regulatory factor (Ser/Thr protein kinase)